MYRLSGTFFLLAGITAIAQAQPIGNTLACKGTITNSSAPDDKVPISRGVTINFAAGLVQGFAFPGLIDYPLKITAANDVTVAFGGSELLLSGTSLSSTQGSIGPCDRRRGREIHYV